MNIECELTHTTPLCSLQYDDDHTTYWRGTPLDRLYADLTYSITAVTLLEQSHAHYAMTKKLNKLVY